MSYVLENGKRMYCRPCLDRSRRKYATQLIGGQPWCKGCATGQEEPEMAFSLIHRDEIPMNPNRSVIWQAVHSLKRNRNHDIAVKLDLKGKSAARMQKIVHEYAVRFGVDVTTSHVNGVLFIEKGPMREPEAQHG
jgi:hypothetical protein